MPSYLLVTNPFSGRGLSEREIGFVAAAFARQGAHVDIVRTRGPGEGSRAVAERKRDYAAIVAAGGDGTINEVVNGLAGSRVPIGIIPRGTGNVLARELDIPRRLAKSVEVVLGGKELPLDVGMVQERRFILMVSAGYDAQVVYEAHLKRKIRFGYFSFVFPMLRTLKRGNFPEIKVDIDGRSHTCRHVVVANVRGYGGPFRPAPHAIYNDGDFDVVMYQRPGRFSMMRYCFLALCESRKARDDDILRLRCSSLTLSSREAVRYQVDGDPAGVLPCHLQIMGDGATFMVP